jgi:hypothetical protein
MSDEWPRMYLYCHNFATTLPSQENWNVSRSCARVVTIPSRFAVLENSQSDQNRTNLHSCPLTLALHVCEFVIMAPFPEGPARTSVLLRLLLFFLLLNQTVQPPLCRYTLHKSTGSPSPPRPVERRQSVLDPQPPRHDCCFGEVDRYHDCNHIPSDGREEVGKSWETVEERVIYD